MLFSVHGDLFLFCAQRESVSGVLDHGSDGSMDHCSLRFYICLHVFTGAFGGSFCSANVLLPKKNAKKMTNRLKDLSL